MNELLLEPMPGYGKGRQPHAAKLIADPLLLFMHVLLLAEPVPHVRSSEFSELGDEEMCSCSVA